MSDFDLEYNPQQLKEDEAAAKRKKALYGALGSVFNTLGNRRSEAEILLGLQQRQSTAGAGFQALAESVEDPYAKRKKLAEAYLQDRGLVKAKEEDAKTAQMRDPNSKASRAAKAFFSSRGLQVSDDDTAESISQRLGESKEYSLAEFKEDQNRKTEIVKASAKNKKTPKGFQYGVNPLTGETELQPTTKNLTPDKILQVNEGNSIPKSLTDVETTVTNMKDDMGPIEGRLRGANPYDTKAQTAQSQIKTAAQAFGRFMEGGVLRKEDEAKYERMFPKLSDTPEVAANKISIVKRLLAEKQKSNLDALKTQGYNVEGLDQHIEIPELPGVIAGQGVGTQKAAATPKYEEMSDAEIEALYNQRVKKGP